MSAATRATLTEQFCQIYSSEPLEKITVKEVSSRAGVSRVTFYNYFQDTYDLLNQIEDEFIASIIETIRATFDGEFRPEAFFGCFVESAEQNANMMRVLLAGSHSGVFADKIKKAAIPLVQSSLHANMDNPNARYAIEYHVSGMVALLRRWLLVGDIDVQSMAACVSALLTDGVLATLRSQ